MEGEEQYSLQVQGNVTQGWRSQGMMLLLLSFSQHILRKRKEDSFSWVSVFPFQLRASPGAAFLTGKHHWEGERRAVLEKQLGCCQGEHLAPGK